MGALEDDLTEHHRMRTIEDLRKDFLEIESLRKELAEAKNLATYDYMNGQAELSAVRKELAETKTALEVYDRTFPKKSELELHAALEAANARIAEFADKGTLQALRDANNRTERAEDALKEQLQWIKWYTDRAERAEAEADSLRATIDNMRAMNIKLTMDATSQVLAAEAECKALRALLTRWLECMGNFAPPRLIDDTRAALNPSPGEE